MKFGLPMKRKHVKDLGTEKLETEKLFDNYQGSKLVGNFPRF